MSLHTIRNYWQKLKKKKEDLKAKVEKWHNSSKNLNILLNCQMSTRDKAGLRYGDQLNKGVLSYENKVFQSVFVSRTHETENSPVNDRYIEGMHAVPHPMTGIYIPSGPDKEIDDSQFTYGPKQSKPSESDARSSDINTCESNCSEETHESMPEPVVNEPKVVSQPKVWSDAPIIEEYESDSEDEHVFLPTKEHETPSFAFINTVKHVKTPRQTVKEQNTCSQSPKPDKKDCSGLMAKKLGLGYGFTKKACFVCGSFSHLIRDCDFHEKMMAKQAELNNRMSKGSGQRKIRPVWNNVQRLNHQNQFVPKAVLTRTGKIQVNTARTSGTNTVNTARHNFNRQAVPTNAARKVNTVKPIVNNARPKDYPQRALQNKGIVDSGCSRHMTGNKAYLAEYQDFNGGPIAFGGSKGYITGKGKIKTGKLDFKDVCFVKELQHFNLFSVSQMCDKKNKVLFTDTECLVLSPEFKLPDENQVLLRIPRQNNMYSFNLENIVPSGGLACLIAKATFDESNKWHRRLGHVNFKNLNKLVKGNLVRGLPSKIFQNDHTCVACQKGKQHKASCKAKSVSSISQPLQLLHMDLFGPTSVRSLNHKTYCLVITDDFSRFSWVFFLRTKDETSGILKDFIRQIQNQLNQKVKTIRCDNGTEFKNRDFIEFCGSKGIKREYSNARTPQQNGVAERKNRTLIEAARTMLADSFLPNTFWAEAVSTACYVLNRVLVTKPQNKTPYELITDEIPPPPPPPPSSPQTPTQQTPHTVSTIKLPILKKGEYDIWAMKMEHYLAHTDYPIWEVIQNGNGPVSITTDTQGQIKVLPPRTAEEIVARERERKARTTLLMALPEDHLAKFHKMTDAKEMWDAIKSRFGGNDESKKMFQSLLSQLEIHGAGVSTEDANQKFLRSLPSAWSQVSLIMRTKPGVDSLSFDDLYNNLRVFENDVKGSTASSSSSQNVAFVSENTNSTNDVSTAYSVSNTSGQNPQYEQTSSYSLLANQSSCPQLDHEDLEQLDEYDLEEMDLKWQVAMISMRMKKFYKKTGHFARECRIKENQDNRMRDAWNSLNKDGSRTGKKEDSKALVTIDGEGVDWTSHSKEDERLACLLSTLSIRHKGSQIDGNYMPTGPDIEVDYSQFTIEPSELVSEPVVNESNVDDQPKDLVLDSPIFEEYESKHRLETRPTLLKFKTLMWPYMLLELVKGNNLITGKENIVPSEIYACLMQKATIDESDKWHREGWVISENQAKQNMQVKQGKLITRAAKISSNLQPFTLDLKTDAKREGPREEEQVFLDELERLKRQEKDANKAAETHRKDPHDGLSLSNPINPEQDDSEIPPLEDIYQNSTDGIFTHSSYDDEGVSLLTSPTWNYLSNGSENAFLYGKIDEEGYMCPTTRVRFPYEFYGRAHFLLGLQDKQKADVSIFIRQINMFAESMNKLDMQMLRLLVCACSRFQVPLQSPPSKCLSREFLADPTTKALMLARFHFLVVTIGMITPKLQWFKGRQYDVLYSLYAVLSNIFARKVTAFICFYVGHQLADEVPLQKDHSEAQPTPSPIHTSEVPLMPQTDPSPTHTSEVPVEPQTDPSPRPSPSNYYYYIHDSYPESSWWES
ncbi:putative ribonuclease H-like domain-containing protein [Tanacetum coccineum]|uniref:Ribonuclease H-like domain-containing protein n=1 Tax=Tanacetum coccineum TaxID=301880 RepID=A0ABQ5HQX8_9ASTR